MDDLVNKRVRALAADHGLTVPETLAALDKHPIELDRDQFLRRTLALELIELDQLQQAFRDKALEDRDVGSGFRTLPQPQPGRSAVLSALQPAASGD